MKKILLLKEALDDEELLREMFAGEINITSIESREALEFLRQGHTYDVLAYTDISADQVPILGTTHSAIVESAYAVETINLRLVRRQRFTVKVLA